MENIILLDLDDVITDFIPTLINVYNSIHEDDNTHTLEEITQWEIPDGLFKYNLFEAILEPNVLENMALKEGAFDTIKEWYNKGYKIVIVTATNGELEMSKKRQWLRNTGLDKYITDIIMTKHKYLINGDILVDDRYENLLQWKESNPNGAPILMNAQHNKKIDSKFIRVRNWKELAKWVDLTINY